MSSIPTKVHFYDDLEDRYEILLLNIVATQRIKNARILVAKFTNGDFLLLFKRLCLNKNSKNKKYAVKYTRLMLSKEAALITADLIKDISKNK